MPAFIERLPNFLETERHLKEGERQQAVTAVMVGEVGANSISPKEIFEWLPIDEWLRFLGIARGHIIGFPWIEFRDEHGALARRIHIIKGISHFGQGHAALDELQESGSIGRLLSFAKPGECRKHYGISLHYLIRGLAEKGAYLDERFRDVCLVLNGLCEQHGFKSDDLREPLDDQLRENVRLIFEQTATSIKELKSGKEKTSQKTLEHMASKLKNNIFIDIRFGRLVLELLEDCSLADADVLKQCRFRGPNGMRVGWDDLITQWRNRLMHGRYLDFASDVGVSCFPLNRHLADIALRVVLKDAGYVGQYRPAIYPFPGMKNVDWVTADTTPAELGYSP